MRLHVVTIALSASFLGLSAAEPPTTASDNSAGAATSPAAAASLGTQSVNVVFPLAPSQAAYVISDSDTTAFNIENPGNIDISRVRLKIYDNTGVPDGHEDKEVTHAYSPNQGDQTSCKASDPTCSETATWVWSSTSTNSTIQVRWSKILDQINFDNKPVYVECEWKNGTDTGRSTSQLFAVYQVTDKTAASNNLVSLGEIGTNNSPARKETIIPTSQSNTSPAPSSTAPTSNTGQPPSPSVPPATTSTSASAATSSSSSSSPNGLSKGGTIGIAVGVSIGGLLVAAAISWLLCLRRRRRHHDRNLARHGMSSYESDVGARAMMADKEAPLRLESSSRQSAYGGVGEAGVVGFGGGDGGRASLEQQQQHSYAPYSDRSGIAVSPAPAHMPFPQQQQQQQLHGMTTSSDAIVVEHGIGGVGGGGNATTTTATSVPGAPASYAHLIEDGMTPEEIRRLEEEERQLDAAIEADSRRGNS